LQGLGVQFVRKPFALAGLAQAILDAVAAQGKES